MAIKAILFDMSGVLYEDEQPLPGALQIISKLQTDAIPMRFVTNTSRTTSTNILSKLDLMGFKVNESQIFTAPKALKQYCIQHQLRPFCLVHPDLAPEFVDIDQSEPNAVIVADAGEYFNYRRMNKAFSLLMQGVPLLGIGLNRYFKTQGELHLDAGPFIKALEFASGAKALILGKPAAAFFQEALDSLNLTAEEVLMIGDDVEADIGGALDAGLHACLVQTGKYLAGDENKFKQCFLATDVSEAVNHYFYEQTGS